MNIKSIYSCEKCYKDFDYEYQCKDHEKECGVQHLHVCDKCGKETHYSKDKDVDQGYTENSLWTLTPNHYRAGYGSGLDGSEFVLNLCDDCMCGIVYNCKHKERLLNSGSNSYYDYPDDHYDEEDYQEDYEDYNDEK